jgi:hypothetical protein
LIGNSKGAVGALTISPTTNAQAVETQTMEPNSAIELRKCDTGSPYDLTVWRWLLHNAALLDKYHNIPLGLQYSFDAGIKPIINSYTPFNHPSINQHLGAFCDGVQSELEKGQYIGPLKSADISRLIGPFQTSPLSIIPKSGKPGKFQLNQTFLILTLC